MFFLNMSSRILNKSDACIFFKPFLFAWIFFLFFPTLPITFLIVRPLIRVNVAVKRKRMRKSTKMAGGISAKIIGVYEKSVHLPRLFPCVWQIVFNS
jgi:hypothetical protein